MCIMQGCTAGALFILRAGRITTLVLSKACGLNIQIARKSVKFISKNGSNYLVFRINEL
jgi:hypothetical protein